MARFKVPKWGAFYHTERLRDHPARLKLVLSDSTNMRPLVPETLLEKPKINGRI